MSVSAQDRAATSDEDLRRAISKTSRRIIPFLGLLVFVNYLDRTNIGLAGPNGLTRDLGMSGREFGFASGIFFIGYLLLEIPSNFALHRFGARKWLARIVVSWGIVASLFAFVPNAGSLVTLRFVLGIAEAGFFPGVVLYLTYWFPARVRTRYLAIYLAAVPLSSAIGAPASSLIIQHFDGLFGLAGWRSMFLLEGIPAILVGVLTWFVLPNGPSAAKWLTPGEKQALNAELVGDGSVLEGELLSLREIGRSLRSSTVWKYAGIYFGFVYGLNALAFFLPTVIANFQHRYGVHYTIIQKGLLTAVPYAFAVACMVPWGAYAARTRDRAWHYSVPALIAGTAIPITLYLDSPYAAIIAVSICAAGIMSALPAFWSQPTRALGGTTVVTGIAAINSIGNFAGFLGPYSTGWANDATGSDKAGLWLIGIALLASGAAMLLLRVPQSRGAAQQRPGRLGQQQLEHPIS